MDAPFNSLLNRPETDAAHCGPDAPILHALRAEHDAERRTAAWVNRASWIIAFIAIATLLTLLFAFQRASVWLALITAFSVGTRLSSLITHYRFLVPRFLLDLGSDDPARAAAARALLEERREQVVRPILQDRIEPAGPEAVAAATPEFLLDVARRWDIPARARFARRCLVAYLAVAATLAIGLIATRGSVRPAGRWLVGRGTPTDSTRQPGQTRYVSALSGGTTSPSRRLLTRRSQPTFCRM